nr:hypothetical protein [Arthrobacter sp. N199823]
MRVIDKATWAATALFTACMHCLEHGYQRSQRHQRHGQEDHGQRLNLPIAFRPATGRSTGDVPGWVLITLMSAVLVAGLLAIAGPALQGLFNQAMEQVQP